MHTSVFSPCSCFFLLLSKQEHYEAVQCTLTSENHPLQLGLCQICSPVPLLTQTPMPSKKGWCRSKNEQLGKGTGSSFSMSTTSTVSAMALMHAQIYYTSYSLLPYIPLNSCQSLCKTKVNSAV